MANVRAEIRQAQRADEKATVRYAPGTVFSKHVYKDHNKYSPVSLQESEDQD